MGIVISTMDCPHEFKEKLCQEEEYLNSVGINFMFDEDKNKDYTLFNINFDQSGYSNSLKESLADIIAEIVVNNLEGKIINKIIKHEYDEFNPEERTKIEEFTVEHLNKRYNLNNNLVSKIVRKREIITQLLKYLEKNQDLNIEGFVRFRLKDYVDQLKLAVDEAVDDYIIKREYEEFVDLLRYFVEIQEPRLKLVNVLKNEDGSFQILDPEKRVIKNEYLEGYIEELMDGEVEFEDLLVSALINISPQKIILHFNDEGVKETLESIFSERIEICRGCDLCHED